MGIEIDTGCGPKDRPVFGEREQHQAQAHRNPYVICNR